jgi:hypothetical protein
MTVDKMMPVTEGDRVGFTCKISGNPRIVSYARSGEGLITSWKTIEGRCDQFEPPDTTLYTASCDRANSMFYMTILNVTSSFHHIISDIWVILINGTFPHTSKVIKCDLPFTSMNIKPSRISAESVP